MTIGPLPPNHEWMVSWDSAVSLYRHLINGGAPEEVTTSLLLAPDEKTYSDLTLGYARFYGMDTGYHRSDHSFIGSPLFVAAGMAFNAVSNSLAKWRAENQAAPQWREHCPARVIVTRHDTLCFAYGRWLRFPHSSVVDFNVDMLNGICYLIFTDAEPLQLAGPQVPWLAVLLASFLYGPDRLPGLPFLQSIAQG